VPRAALFFALGTLAWGQAFPLWQAEVRGNKRLSTEAILAETGLTIGKEYTEADFKKAYGKLGATGLFTNARYKYQGAKRGEREGYALTWEVEEVPPGRAEVDIAEMDGGEFWRRAREANPLLTPDPPDTPAAVAFYERELNRMLERAGKEVRVKTEYESNLDRGSIRLVFVDANAPFIGGFQIAGKPVLLHSEILNALRTGVGMSYSPRKVSQLLDRNLKPLYRKEGHLAATWRVDQGSFTRKNGFQPSLLIEAGPTYKVASFDVLVDGAPATLAKKTGVDAGATAKMDVIEAAVEKLREPLYKEGYLQNQATLDEALDSAAKTVKLTAKYDRGAQYFTRALTIQGLNPKSEEKVRRFWKLKTGAPYDKLAADAFLKELYANNMIPENAKLSAETRTQGNQVEFVVRFSL
jgi:outer membrane protein assembly factor BamA